MDVRNPPSQCSARVSVEVCFGRPIGSTGFDVEHPLRIATVDASIGRIPDLQGSPREGPESAP
jgi:hypothetical protein